MNNTFEIRSLLLLFVIKMLVGGIIDQQDVTTSKLLFLLTGKGNDIYKCPFFKTNKGILIMIIYICVISMSHSFHLNALITPSPQWQHSVKLVSKGSHCSLFCRLHKICVEPAMCVFEEIP